MRELSSGQVACPEPKRLQTIARMINRGSSIIIGDFQYNFDVLHRCTQITLQVLRASV